MLLTFTAKFWIYVTLLVVSSAMVGLLLYTFSREQKNLILRSLCVLILIMNIVLSTGLNNKLLENSIFVTAQSLLLAYFFTAVQAHGFTLMFNQCYTAFGWRIKLFEPEAKRLLLLILLSYAVPLIPPLGLILLIYSDQIRPIPKAFYANFYITANGSIVFWFFSYPFWLFFYSLLGTILTLILLSKTFAFQMKMRELQVESQFSASSIIRITLTSTFQITLSIVSSFIIYNIPQDVLIPELSLLHFNPWKGACDRFSDGELESMLKSIRCPTYSSYMPVLLGFVLFSMYGFSLTARDMYRSIWLKTEHILGCARKRKNSTIVLNEPNVRSSTLSSSSSL